MQTRSSTGRGFRIWLLPAFFGVLLVIAYAVSRQVDRLSDYYTAFDKYSASIHASDPVFSRRYLDSLRTIYAINQQSIFGDFIEKRFFKDAPFMEARYQLLIGEYQKVVKMFDGNEDYRACHLVGVSLFRFHQARYAAAKKEERAAIVEAVFEEVHPYFECVIREGPKENPEARYNYDLTSNPEATASALGGAARGPGDRLGSGGSDKPGGEEEDREVNDGKKGGRGDGKREG